MLAYARNQARCDRPVTLLAPNEAMAIKATGRASRKGRTLRVSGVAIADVPNSPEGYKEYRYAGVYPGGRYDLVAASYYEGAGAILVDSLSHTSAEVGTPPIPSPGGKTFVATSRGDGFEYSTVQIIELTPKGLKAVADFDEKAAYGACDPKWITDNRVDVRVFIGAPNDAYVSPPWSRRGSPFWRWASFRRIGGKWRYFPPK